MSKIVHRFNFPSLTAFALTTFFLVSFVASAKPPKNLPLLDRMVASVNQDAITESELNKQTELLLARLRQTDTTLPPMSVLKQQILEKMIVEKLQLQMAADEGIDIDDVTLNNALKDIAERDNLTVAQLKQVLEEQNVPFAHFREAIKTELTISRLQQKTIGQQISVGNVDIENFLKSPAGQDQTGTEYRLGHILISLPEAATTEQSQSKHQKAEAIIQELKSGANFAQVAMAKSAGQQALNGGDLGFRKVAEIPSLFAKIAPALQVGEVYGPIHDTTGIHIIKLIDKRLTGTQQASSEAMRNKAMEILYQRKFDEHLVTWLRKLRDGAEVSYFLE